MRQLSGIDVTLPQHGDVDHLRPRLVAQHLRSHRGARRGRCRGDEAADPRTDRPAGAVPAAPRRGSARARPAVLDRGSRLRHRLPRPPPRGRAARHSRAARRGDQPHPRAPARSSTAAVGAVRHRRCRWWPPDRPAHQGPPRRDRRCGRGAHARRDPRHRPRRASHRRATPVDARPDPDRPGAAAADVRGVRAAAREADPPVGAVVAGAGGVDAGRRVADPRRSHRPADAGTARIADAHAPPARLRVRGRPAAAPAADGGAANAVEQVDLTAPEVRLHHDRARVGEAGAAGDRLHVQRRRDGDLLRDAAALPA